MKFSKKNLRKKLNNFVVSNLIEIVFELSFTCKISSCQCNIRSTRVSSDLSRCKFKKLLAVFRDVNFCSQFAIRKKGTQDLRSTSLDNCDVTIITNDESQGVC